MLPTVVVQLMGLDPNADNYFDRVRTIVETEPNVSTRLLVAANSASNPGRAPVATVGEALTRIGSRSAANLLLALAVARVFIPRSLGKGLMAPRPASRRGGARAGALLRRVATPCRRGVHLRPATRRGQIRDD